MKKNHGRTVENSQYYNHHERNEKKGTKNNILKKIAGVALGASIVTGAAFGVKSLLDYETAQNEKLFVPNGNELPITELLDDEEENEINFSTIDDDCELVLLKNGSIRTSPISADPEKMSSILLNNRDIILGDVREIGYYNAAGDYYYVVKLDDMPEYVQDYVAANDIELSDINGEERVFINVIDADIKEVGLVQDQDSDAASAVN